jgi:hypothetical protein
MFGAIGDALSGAAGYLGGLLGFSPEAANQAAPNPAPVGPQAPQPNAGLLSGLTPEQQRLLEQFRAMQGLSKTFGDVGGQRAPMPGLLPTPDIFAHRRAGRM